MDERPVVIGRCRRMGDRLLAIAGVVQEEVEAGVLSMSMVLKEPESGEGGIYRMVFDCAEISGGLEEGVKELELELNMERLVKVSAEDFALFLVSLRGHVREAIDGKGNGEG